MRGSDAGGVFGAKEIGEQRGLAIAKRVARNDQLDLVGHGFIKGAGERATVIDEHKTRREQVDDRAQLAEVARHQ